MSDLNKLLNKSLLYDFYNKLLTDKQCMVYEMYHMQDLSLNEIGEEWEISKQGVRDLLKRTESLLMSYESKLGLVKKHELQQSKIAIIQNSLDEMIKASSNTENVDILKQVKSEIESIINQ